MSDPMAAAQLAIASKLKMLPSEFRKRATNWDIVQILAWDRTQDKEWQKQYEREKQIAESRKMTPEQQADVLFRGM